MHLKYYKTSLKSLALVPNEIFVNQIKIVMDLEKIILFNCQPSELHIKSGNALVIYESPKYS